MAKVIRSNGKRIPRFMLVVNPDCGYRASIDLHELNRAPSDNYDSNRLNSNLDAPATIRSQNCERRRSERYVAARETEGLPRATGDTQAVTNVGEPKMGCLEFKKVPRWLSSLFRTVTLRRSPVLPLEAYRSQPKHYYIWSGSIMFAMVCGIYIGCRSMEPVTTSLIAATLVAHAALVPAVRTPEGGTLTFPTAILLTSAFLYGPATVFVGVSVGWTIGHTVFHRRETWRGVSNALILALGASSGAAIVLFLRSHLPPAAVIAVGPALLLAANRVTNVALLALLAFARWSMAPWPYFLARIRSNMLDQFIDITWLLPATLGSVLLPGEWWWVVLTVSLPVSALSGLIMIRSYGWKTTVDPAVSDSLARIDDPRVQAIVGYLARGAALIDRSGYIFLITPAALSLCGQREASPDIRLHDLFAESDGPTLDRLLVKAARNTHPQTIEVRPRSLKDRTVFITIANRLADSRLRGFAVTVQEAASEHRRWHALSRYADRTFAAPLVHALEDERSRVGQEVDSSIRQTLALLQLALDHPGRKASPTPQDLVRRALTAARSIQRTLAPPELHDFGLLATIRTYASDLRASGMEIRIETALSDDVRFDPDSELVAFRVIQWAVDNVIRHAGVNRATVRLDVTDGTLRIIVSDTGRGFDVQRVHIVGGLTQIEGRVSLIGGTVTIESEPGKGTRLVIDLPANADPATKQQAVG
jgi:signal transduction histidine kinase